MHASKDIAEVHMKEPLGLSFAWSWTVENTIHQSRFRTERPLATIYIVQLVKDTILLTVGLLRTSQSQEEIILIILLCLMYCPRELSRIRRERIKQTRAMTIKQTLLEVPRATTIKAFPESTGVCVRATRQRLS